MFKFIKYLLLFLLYSSALYIILIIIWGDFSPIKENLNYKIGAGGHAFTRLKELNNTKDVDILFLGSSHTYLGFDTRIFREAGYKSFNLGTNSQTPIQTEFLLSKYLDSLNPEIVIFDVCPLIFSLDGIESTLEIISNRIIDLETVKLVFKQNHLKVYNTLIYALYRETIHNDKSEYIEYKKRDMDTYVYGGFVEKEIKFYEQESFKKQNWKYRKEQLKSFQNIVKMINKKNIELILVQTPIVSDLYKSYTNNLEFDNEMRKYGNYYNFNELIQLLDSVHFSDNNHLNKNGINIFNKEILKILNQSDSVTINKMVNSHFIY